MSLNIKNPEVERLVREVADLAGETKTEAVRRALEERRKRLAQRGRRRRTLADALDFMEREIWSTLPPEVLGRPPMTRAEEDDVLGFGPEGV